MPLCCAGIPCSLLDVTALSRILVSILLGNNDAPEEFRLLYLGELRLAPFYDCWLPHCIPSTAERNALQLTGTIQQFGGIGQPHLLRWPYFGMMNGLCVSEQDLADD